jgi:flagellin
MRINYNISAIIARNALNNNDNNLTISTQRLSSGYKINSAKDDAAGLAIARKMKMQLQGLERASDNSEDGLSVTDTADGAMSEMHSILQRLNELAVQSANGTNADSDRELIQQEVDELVEEIDRIADTTEFNAQNLLDGSFAYKGYTNNENVKVMSYSEEVNKGIYQIKGITFFKYEDETITYPNSGNNTYADVVTGVDYEISSADDVKFALNTVDDAANGIKGFPEGAMVDIDDEYIYITDDQGFELKLYVNDRDNSNFQSNAVTKVDKADLETYTYKNTWVKTTLDGKDYDFSIDSIIARMRYQYDANGNKTLDTLNIYSDGSPDSKERFSSIEKNLEEGMGLEIKSVDRVDLKIVNGKESVVVLYTAEDANLPQQELTLEISSGKLANSIYSKSTRTTTQYTVGSATDPINIDITKMGAMLIQTGANEGQQLEMEIPELHTRNLGINGLSVSTEDDATEAIDIVADAINQLSQIRSKIGAYANRLEHTVANLDTADENVTESYSRIMDTDMAEEMTTYANNQVLVQAATSVLAQANERTQMVLQLLQ